MKVLYILKSELTDTAKTICESHKKNHEVSLVELENKSADELLDLIESHDKLIMW